MLSTRPSALNLGMRLVFISCFWCVLAVEVEATEWKQRDSAQTNTTSKDPKLSAPLSILLHAVPQREGPPRLTEQSGPQPSFSPDGLPKSITDRLQTRRMRITSKGEVQVYIELNDLSDENIQVLRSLGLSVQIIGKPAPNRSKGEVLNKISTVQALLPVTKIEQAEKLSFVRFIRLPDYAVGNTGSVDTQGDAILQADKVRSLFGVDGTGIRVGVISDGIGGIFANGCTTCGPTSSNPSPITLEDLPSATGTRNSTGILVAVNGGIVAKSFNSDGDLEACLITCDPGTMVGAEGTAMLEIIHDLAPGAQLYFANSDSSMSFEQAADFLAANTDVIVTDLSFFTAPFDGTSSVSVSIVDALNNATNPVRALFTSAGNYAQNHYQGLYLDSGVDGTAITGQAGDLHLFQPVPPNPQSSPSGTTDNEDFKHTVFDPIIVVPPSQSLEVYLAWNDPTGASNNNYDLFLSPLNCSGVKNSLPLPPCTIAGSPVASSTNPQNGTQDPTETVVFTNSTNSMAVLGIAIQNVGNSAAARTFDIFVHGYGDKQSSPNHNFNTISGSVPAVGDAGGLPMMASVLTVGAIDKSHCSAPDNCIGPVEPYSSQGPTQTTPQSTGRIKPDLIGIDQICISGAGGFGNGPALNCPPSQPSSYTPRMFGGSSAAVPHVAAVAALGLEAAPCLLSGATNPQPPSTARMNLQGQIVATAVPLSGVNAPTPNNVEGNGLVDALGLVTNMLPSATSGSSQTANATSANGAAVVLTGAGTDPNKCPLTAVKWSGNCGTGSSSGLGLHANLSCPIGINTVQVSVSNNGISFSQPGIVPYTVIVTDFMLSASPGTAAVLPGYPAIYAIAAAPTSQGAFSNPVSLICSSGLPPNTACSFSPSSVTPGTSSVVSNLTIYSSNTAMGPSGPWMTPKLKAISFWPGIVILGVALVIVMRAKSFEPMVSSRFLPLTILIILIASPSGCGSYNITPAPKTYTVTITGTSNQLQHSTTVSLTIQ
jgi:hypothetical protein